MLRPDPVTRPTMHEIYQDEFFRSGYLPTTLPPSSLSMAPRFSANASILEPAVASVAQKDTKGTDTKNALQRRPLFEINQLQPAVPMVRPEENRRRSHAMHVINGESRLMTCEEAKKHGLGEEDGGYFMVIICTGRRNKHLRFFWEIWWKFRFWKVVGRCFHF